MINLTSEDFENLFFPDVKVLSFIYDSTIGTLNFKAEFAAIKTLQGIDEISGVEIQISSSESKAEEEISAEVYVPIKTASEDYVLKDIPEFEYSEGSVKVAGYGRKNWIRYTFPDAELRVTYEERKQWNPE